jgi:2'-5' RNA ligase
MRVFYSLNFYDETKNEIKNIKNAVEENSIKGKFVKSKNYHLTLEFIGEVDEEKVKILKKVLCELKTSPYKLSFNKIGNFNRRGGDIVWIGVEDNSNLYKLSDELRSLLKAEGFETDKRKYTPHLTIGRRVLMEKSYENIHLHAFDAKVKSIALMESKRIDGELIYQPIAEVEVRY